MAAEMTMSPPSSETPTAELKQKKPKFTWQDLEMTKSRAACAMDRVEFLATTRNRFTEFRKAEADALGLTIRSRSSPNVLLQKNLATSADNAAAVLAKQEMAAQNGQTGFKRLDAVNRFVIDKELRTGGKQAAESAKNFSKNSQCMRKPYPTYDELMKLVTHEPGQPREPPLGPGTCLMNYQPPEEALRHGMSKSLYSLSSTSRSTKSNS
eukprot:gb/GFBE01009928.1/.p1 GENE.gb/GFBE01009928.1/~~gb/GFBE01009928.1/.p1  ORF type:complete len:210 (+),score=43.30 gb/GFBE01009928.1/:1-630(+)